MAGKLAIEISGRVKKDQPYAQEGYDLMGAAFEVHKQLGGGLLEENALLKWLGSLRHQTSEWLMYWWSSRAL